MRSFGPIISLDSVLAEMLRSSGYGRAGLKDPVIMGVFHEAVDATLEGVGRIFKSVEKGFAQIDKRFPRPSYFIASKGEDDPAYNCKSGVSV